MVVRVKVRIERWEKAVETSALANSGYEAETPQILVPIRLAEILGLWPTSSMMEETEFDTAGGPIRVWVAQGRAE